MNSVYVAKNMIDMGNVESSQPPFPDPETLMAGLKSVFGDNSTSPRQLEVLSRQPNIYSSTFASEVMTCRFANGRKSQVFCKYGVSYIDAGTARRGVPYEVEVYSQLLEQLPLSTPQLFGSYLDATTGRTWLVLEFLDSYVRVNKTCEQDALRLAARWIGRFHATGEKHLSRVSISDLNIYNAEYYDAWRGQMSVIPDYLKRNFSWLSDLCKRSNGFIAPLVAAPSTIIHGEFFPSNALIRNGDVYVVDWESAGVGAGELDLAALTMGPWPEEMIQECEAEYRLARWFERSPDNFDRTLTAARLYYSFKSLFRLLRVRPNRTMRDVWLFENLRTAGERLGLI